MYANTTEFINPFRTKVSWRYDFDEIIQEISKTYKTLQYASSSVVYKYFYHGNAKVKIKINEFKKKFRMTYWDLQRNIILRIFLVSLIGQVRIFNFE